MYADRENLGKIIAKEKENEIWYGLTELSRTK